MQPPFFKLSKKETKSLCIIVEGYEETCYLNRLKDLGVWSDTLQITIVNAKGNGNLFYHYQSKWQSNNFDCVIILCDTEDFPYAQFKLLKEKINNMHASAQAAEMVVYFTNPCTLQIILNHFKNINLKTQAKKQNALIVEKVTGIKKYQASEQQLCALMHQVTQRNFASMLNRLKNISTDYNTVPSSNFICLAKRLKKKDTTWIDEINNLLDSSF